MDLVSVNNNIKELSTTFLEILHKYAVAGLSKGDNYDLVMAAFKVHPFYIFRRIRLSISYFQMSNMIL